MKATVLFMGVEIEGYEVTTLDELIRGPDPATLTGNKLADIDIYLAFVSSICRKAMPRCPTCEKVFEGFDYETPVQEGGKSWWGDEVPTQNTGEVVLILNCDCGGRLISNKSGMSFIPSPIDDKRPRKET